MPIDTNTMLDMFDTLSESRKVEVMDFINFLNYQETKSRIMESDNEPRISFNSTDALMQAIEDAD
ncbi:MAG: hypothetical protein HQK96_17095 [Nitrospirae bacterium]|nr:hypothetical protein [Nitrospirota bacterium]